MKPEFSIIIPVYNVENYLEECISSVLEQDSFESFNVEIILVNDGSTDKSGSICDYYSKQYNFVKVIHQENKGLLQARRAGFKVATGNYIINLDSDDLLSPNSFAYLHEIIIRTNPDIIFYNMSFLIDEEIRPYYSNVFTLDCFCELSKAQVLDYFSCSNIPIVSSMAGKAIKRTVIDIQRDYSKYGKFSMGEDTLQTAELISRSQSFYYLNKCIYIYRIGSGMTSKFIPDYYKIFRNIIVDAYTNNDLAEPEKCITMFNESILLTGCRAIAQSKTEKEMTYSERKLLFTSILEDSEFIKALNNIRISKSRLERKHRIILYMLKSHAFLALHIVLKIHK